MPREPGVFVRRGWWVTSAGGVKNRKLVPEAAGKKAAKQALAVILAERVGAIVAGSGINLPTKKAVLLQQAIDDFFDFKLAEYGADSLAYRDYRLRLAPLISFLGNKHLASVTDVDGMKFRQWLHKEKPWKKGNKMVKGLKASAVNSKLRAAKTFWNWVSEPERRQKYGVPTNPWKKVDLLPERSRERVINDNEFEALIANCTDGNVAGAAQDFREILTVLRHTTMRPGELRLLRWDYIQWDAHRIVYPLDVIKNRRRRSITMLDQVLATLKARKARTEAQGVKAEGYVFPGVCEKDGVRIAADSARHILTDSFSQRFRRLVKRCADQGLIEAERAGERLVLYSTRHTRITELFVEGHDTAVAMQEAGHSTPLTTERYKHLAPGFITDVVRQKAGNKLAQNQGGD